MTLVDFGYAPLDVHRPFHTATQFERIMFGGYGSGKTWALCAEAIAFMLGQPGSEIVVIRKTVPSLRDTTEAIFIQLLPDEFLAQCTTRRGGGHIQELIFPNGSTVKFRSIPTPADWLKLKSLSVAGLFFDEVDELDQESYEGMLSRVRQTEPTKQAKKLGATRIMQRTVCSASNPAGHNWCYDRFVGPNRVEDSHYTVSRTLDNPTLPISYVETLLAMPGPWVKRYVLASFDEFGGAIFPDWAWDTHVIAPLKTYDPTGFHLMGFDPGTDAGNAALWVYFDKPSARLIGVAEYLETGLAAKVHAAEWRRIEAKHKMRVRRRIADPKAIPVRDRGSNVTLSEQYRRLGFQFVPGVNGIPDRLTALGQLIQQGRFVVTTDCPQTYEQIKNYRWADITPTMRAKGTEAKPLKKDVDLVDAAEYLACAWLAPARVEADEAVLDAHAQDQADIRAAIRKQIQRGRTAQSVHDLGTLPV